MAKGKISPTKTYRKGRQTIEEWPRLIRKTWKWRNIRLIEIKRFSSPEYADMRDRSMVLSIKLGRHQFGIKWHQDGED